eukprot:Blabericola_migrator_1__6696@NODE_3387_length_1815_cov_41_501716_g2110_i0_p2_GENE_NODE_3387_length_1815_cov_41_501716_g2110_i0NODE_3387_length_1815_cov_41_501716_g2110_i0_p2_ORF_typecomplete_len111_score0_29DUF4503/PF14951_6/2_3DUF4503/PF14951_6/1_1_NODE_3387_length_1815_cov_41_501716_g2110_i011501482
MRGSKRRIGVNEGTWYTWRRCNSCFRNSKVSDAAESRSNCYTIDLILCLASATVAEDDSAQHLVWSLHHAHLNDFLSSDHLFSSVIVLLFLSETTLQQAMCTNIVPFWIV